jgi:uncharacterized damage-inducible protein DinB
MFSNDHSETEGTPKNPPLPLDTLKLMRFIAAALLFVSALPAVAQDVKGALVKHLKTSAEFTLKVADAMPAESYDFKLTPPQMSFAEQMIHIAQAQAFFMGYLSSEKASRAKPASNSKADVTAFLKASFDKAIAGAEAATPEQLHTTYKTGEGMLMGWEVIMADIVHTAHHRASAEMYLRAKGITPPEYTF